MKVCSFNSHAPVMTVLSVTMSGRERFSTEYLFKFEAFSVAGRKSMSAYLALSRKFSERTGSP
jgi:hypothetical protein